MLGASIAGFAVFIVPHYNQISELRTQKADYEVVLANARKYKEERNALVKRYNAFDQSKLNQLTTMLPSNPENMKLILALQSVASQYGLLLQNVKTEDSADTTNPGARPVPGSQTSPDLGTITINFSVSGPYSAFTNYIRSIEKSLRMLEIQKISFAASDPKTQNYQYTVSVKTYWLK
jgi:Tfp pilus assembly protein PilO